MTAIKIIIASFYRILVKRAPWPPDKKARKALSPSGPLPGYKIVVDLMIV